MQSQSLPALRPELNFTVHRQGKTLWFAVQSPDKRYLRLGRNEYLVASALDGKRAAPQVAEAVLEVAPDSQMTDESVGKIVAWLAKSGLLQAGDAETKMTAARTGKGLAINPLYTKIPLVDGVLLERVGRWFVPLVRIPTLVLAIALWIVAAACVAANWESFIGTTGNLFVADGYLWWGTAWLFLKTAHELGHAVMAVSIGSRIRGAGISLIFLAPVPYVDISDLWTISNRWHRMLCCAGGMLVELVIAAVAALVALSTESQSLRYFCCALATMGTVTTLAFNASPFVRFDGYFILSDLINFPNLYTDAQRASRQFTRKILFPFQPAQFRMPLGLVAYGLACLQYRVMMMLTLAIGTILAFQGVGILLVAWGAYAAIIGPWIKAKTAARAADRQSPGCGITSPTTGWSRFRERFWLAGLAGGVVCVLVAIPSPIQPATPGYIAYHQPLTIRADADGFLSEVYVREQDSVQAGQLIARLINPELQLELMQKSNAAQASQERIQRARSQGNLAELQAEQAQLESLELQLDQLRNKVRGLEVRCPRNGVIAESELPRSLGLFLRAGEPLALVVQPGHFDVVASVSQDEVEAMRAAQGTAVRVSVEGVPQFEATLESVEPRASVFLQEPMLAANYGGPLPVQLQRDANGKEELKFLAPRFEMRARVPDHHPTLAKDFFLAPGQLASLRLPTQSARLWQMLYRLCQRKWNDLSE